METKTPSVSKLTEEFANIVEAATLERAATLIEFESNNLELATAIRALKEKEE